MIQQKEKVTDGVMPTTEIKPAVKDEGLAATATKFVKVSLPSTCVKQDSQRLDGREAVFNWRQVESEVMQMRQALGEEKRVRAIKKLELREKEASLINELQNTVCDQQQARIRLEEELRENETILEELQAMLFEELHESSRVDEELSQAKLACTKLRERLQTELAQLHRMLDDKERIVEDLQRTLGEEQQARIAVNEELKRATISFTEQEEILQNDLAQMRRTLDDEVGLRNTTELELRNKERIAVELHRTLEEERARVEEELRQARLACYMAEGRLQSELAEMRKAFDDKERTVNGLQKALEEEQRVRTAMGEELSQARIVRNDLEERLGNELLLSQSRQQDLQTKENIIREQRRLLDVDNQQKSALEERLRSLELQMETERNSHLSTVRLLQSALSAAEEALADNQRRQSRDWIIQREEVVVSETILGRGAWGNVRKGIFRGCQVAVKEIHELILSDYNRRLFEREMSIASRCRHPNLLQFIGATNDVGSPLFVTELLDTSLRHVLFRSALKHQEIVSLAQDVAKALNYLHLNKPLPIMHRDISSANVLLWKRDESWRAKLSDYGAANFMRQCRTENPGAAIYSAPEASLTSQHSPKVKYRAVITGERLC